MKGGEQKMQGRKCGYDPQRNYPNLTYTNLVLSIWDLKTKAKCGLVNPTKCSASLGSQHS